ncbi:MAG: HIT domain-containing protein [Candidatus Tectomicrobia bacterium]|uniref:HIT domain-containing protein n=1 Tax=Tectimicrobiota bacterium TaxID=2528274 RepID=A0A933LQI1_UNCTE|nr:HIT domain-containing protein [Candidatus Tectomicrobia bacterium]
MFEFSYCTFCNIVSGMEWANVVYQDDTIMAFDDIWARGADIHILWIPKKHHTPLQLLNDNELNGYLLKSMATWGEKHCQGGFRVVLNNGWVAGQSQPHAHYHLLWRTWGLSVNFI